MWFRKIIRFYIDGFKNMKLGKTLWLIIAIKLAIMVFVLKFFFFSETINTKFDNETDRINFIHNNLTKDIK
ncbi:MAG: DUF4492 domain-containing protein [Campylobacter sp.]|nr:DUF4492 domain-containing protein [Campylobacter sp.]